MPKIARMGHDHSVCDSCAVTFSHQLVDRVGLATLRLAGGHLEQLRCAAMAGRLVVLVPARSHISVTTLGLGDIVVEASVADPSDGSLAVSFFGWMHQPGLVVQTRLADRFAQRHLTADLLDLGRHWSLLVVEAAEARLDWLGRSLRMGPDQAESVLSFGATA